CHRERSWDPAEDASSDPLAAAGLTSRSADGGDTGTSHCGRGTAGSTCSRATTRTDTPLASEGALRTGGDFLEQCAGDRIVGLRLAFQRGQQSAGELLAQLDP